MARLEISTIRDKVHAYRNSTTYSALKSRWDKDYKTYSLEPYKAERGYFAYTSDYPRVYANKLISLLVSAKLNVRIPLDTLTEPDRTVASNIERFFYGCLQLNDDRLGRLAETPSVRQQRAFFSVIRGGFARLAYVYTDADSGQTLPLIQTWDLYNTIFEKGVDGLYCGIHIRPASREEVEETWKMTKLPPHKKEFELIDYWGTKENAVIIDDRWAKKPEEHGLKRNPVTIHKVGVQPLLHEQVDSTINAAIGESALKEIRDLTPIFNKIMSDAITIHHRGVKAPMVYKSAPGKANIEEDIFQVEKTAVVQIDKDENLAPAIPPQMPPDTASILQTVGGEIQRGSLPYTSYGELGQRLSGFAISQLQGSLGTVIQPFTTCMEQAYKMDCVQLLDQYAEEPWSPVNVRGRTGRNQTFGYPKADTISPNMLKKGWYPEIELTPVLPKDDEQKVMMANIARQGDPPLLSMRTIRDQYIGVEDPDLEAEKISQEFGENLVVNKLFKAYMAALEDMPGVPVGQNIKAMNVLTALQTLMGGVMQQGGNGRPQQPTNLEKAAIGTSGAGIPSGETGVPSSTMPSEAMGGLPGGAMNANSPPPTGAV